MYVFRITESFSYACHGCSVPVPYSPNSEIHGLDNNGSAVDISLTGDNPVSVRTFRVHAKIKAPEYLSTAAFTETT